MTTVWLIHVNERQADGSWRPFWYGPVRTKSGTILTEADIERFAREAERGYDLDS